MAQQLTDQDMIDLGLMTQHDQGRARFSLISQRLQKHKIMGHVLKKERIVFSDGKGIQRNLMDKTVDAASHIGLLDQYTYNIQDLLAKIEVYWVMARTHWSYGTVEMTENAGASAILNILKPRRVAAIEDLAHKLEIGGASAPSTSADKINPWGIPYWVVYDAAGGAAGDFVGGLPSGHSTVAGLSLTDHPNFKNWSQDYTDVSETGLFKRLRRALRYMDYETPVSVEQYTRGPGEAQRIYCREDTLNAMETYSKGSGDTVGLSVGGADGNTRLFNKIPVEWWPYLETADTDNAYPIYLLDFNELYMAVLRGFYVNESAPMNAGPEQPLWYHTNIHHRYNYVCTNRKKQGILHKV